MSRVARERASRLREFTDAQQEYRETGSRDALERRNRAMRSGSPEDFRRAGEQIQEWSAREGEARRQKLRDLKYSGPRRKRR